MDQINEHSDSDSDYANIFIGSVSYLDIVIKKHYDIGLFPAIPKVAAPLPHYCLRFVRVLSKNLQTEDHAQF